jgi:hypothetical protein
MSMLAAIRPLTLMTVGVQRVGVGVDEGIDFDVQVGGDRHAVLAADGAQLSVLDRGHGRGRECQGGQGCCDCGFDDLHLVSPVINELNCYE